MHYLHIIELDLLGMSSQTWEMLTLKALAPGPEILHHPESPYLPEY